jgi:exodeoxyribonuclease VII small subunit
MPKTAPREPAPPADFESAMGELEQIVETMEAGDLTLEESLGRYRRGAELLRFCQAQLQSVQDQVKVLEDGLLRDFQPGAGRTAGTGAGEDIGD